jgi:hypothetical protein
LLLVFDNDDKENVMNDTVSSRRRAALPLMLCLAACSSLAWSQTPVLQPSETIEAPADAGPVSAPASFGGTVSADHGRLLIGSAEGYLFRKDRLGDWDHRATLVTPDEGFRYRDAILHGDTAVIQTQYAVLETIIGRVYVYRRTNGDWSLVQTINDPPEAPGSLAESSIAFDGRTIVLGSYHANSAFVYSRNAAGTYDHTATLSEPELPPPNRLNYGVAVAVNGRTIAVTATSANDLAGGVYIYRRSGGTWQQKQVLGASDPQHGARFGSDLALDDGLLLISAPNADADPTGNVPTLLGAAYIFKEDANRQWHEEKKLLNPTNGSFARAIALDRGRAVLQATYIRPHDDDPYGTPFAFSRAFVYDRDHGNWTLKAALEGFQSSNNFAHQIAVEGRHVFAGDGTVQTPDPVFDGQLYEFVVPRR